MGAVRGQKKDEGSVPSAGERLRSRETAVKVFVAGVTFVALFPVNKAAAIAGAMLAPVVSELVTDDVQRHRWSVRRLRRGSVVVAGIGYEEDDAYAARRRATPRSGGRAPGALLAGGAAAAVAIGAIALATTARDHGSAAAALQMGDGPPGEVGGLAGDRRTTHEPKITWHAVPGAGRYIIFRGGRRIATRTGLRFTDTVAAYATYVYRVAAEANGRVGHRSAPFSITYYDRGGSPPPPPPPPPPILGVRAPTDVHVIGPANAPPSLRWTPVPQAVRYSVYRDQHFVGHVSEAAFDDGSNLAPGTHTYWVRALVGGHESDPSRAVPADYEPLLPAPTGLAQAAPNTMAFTWDKVPGAVAYEIYRDGKPRDRVANPPYQDTDQLSDGTYNYTVKAVDARGVEGTVSRVLPIQLIS